MSYNLKMYIAPPASLKRPCTHLASCQSKRASHQRSNHKKETDNLLWQLTAVGHGAKGSACQCQRHLVDCSGKQEHSMASDRMGANTERPAAMGWMTRNTENETTIAALHAIDGGLACTGRPRTTTLCLSGSNPVAMRPSALWRCSIMPPSRACDTGTCAAPLLLLPPGSGGPACRTAASTSACPGSRPAGKSRCASS